MMWFDKYKSSRFLSDTQREYLLRFSEEEYIKMFVDEFYEMVVNGPEKISLYDSVKYLMEDG